MRPASLLLVIALFAGAAGSMAEGQAASEGATPAACLKATRDLQQARLKEAGAPVARETYTAIQGEKTEFARGCLAKLALDRVPADQLSSLAEALAGQEQTPEALALLRRAPAELPGVATVAERLAPTIERYELVGKPASAIEAPTWLNAPAGTSTIAMAGAVTWLQFTAHWCGPCREAYPAAVRLQKQFGARGFRIVMATQLYGYFESRRNLAPADELAAIRDYFPRHGIVWPIAVSDSMPPTMAGGRSVRRVNVNDANYKVAGIPQIHLIDRRGNVRLIMIGFDEANEPRLAAMINRLLNE